MYDYYGLTIFDYLATCILSLERFFENLSLSLILISEFFLSLLVTSEVASRIKSLVGLNPPSYIFFSLLFLVIPQNYNIYIDNLKTK